MRILGASLRHWSGPVPSSRRILKQIWIKTMHRLEKAGLQLWSGPVSSVLITINENSTRYGQVKKTNSLEGWCVTWARSKILDLLG